MNFQTEPAVEYLTSEGRRGLPFSEAVRVGRTLYMSGQIGVDASLKLVPGGIAAKTRQTMENIKATPERHGSSLDRIVKVTVMLADIGDWSEMNRVYATYFPDHLPARSALGTSGLVLGAQVEIECLAMLP